MANEMQRDHLEGEELIEAFKGFGPTNEKDSISYEMLRQTLNEDEGIVLSEYELTELFEMADYDKDAKIGYTDFCRLMMAR